MRDYYKNINAGLRRGLPLLGAALFCVLFSGCTTTRTVREGAVISVVSVLGEPVEGATVMVHFDPPHAVLPSLHESFDPKVLVSDYQGRVEVPELFERESYSVLSSMLASIMNWDFATSAQIYRVTVEHEGYLPFDSGPRYQLEIDEAEGGRFDVVTPDFWDSEPDYEVELDIEYAEGECGC